VTGYWDMPEATRESFDGGWYRTGDVARIDDEGFITILDRVKDMLIRGGENIYCVEIEDSLASHPDVHEVAVFGVPERVLGEVVAAVVRLREGATADFGALTDHVRGRLAAHKVPVVIDGGSDGYRGGREIMTEERYRASLDAGERLFHTVEHGNLEDLRQIFTEGAVIWHNTDELLVDVETTIRTLDKIRSSAKVFRSVDIKREPTPSGFVQQHTLILEMADGRWVRDLACCVCIVKDGRVARMDAYHDSAATGSMPHKAPVATE
jgi:ketosteroid isomerase-like protein